MNKSEPRNLENILDGVKIPPAPEILNNLNGELQKDEPDMTRMAAIIQKDPGLSSLVIRTVNSPMFPLRSQVTSIQQAISMLGIGYMINIVMGLVLRRTFETQESALPGFWDSPTNIAMIMSQLSRKLTRLASDEAYMLGLFHNVGHTLIRQRHTDYFAFFQQHLNHPDASITEFEQAQYNFDHATLGYFLARSWGLPEDICQAIRFHHEALDLLDQGNVLDSDNRVPRLLALLKLAEHIDALYQGRDHDHEWGRYASAVMQYLGLSEPDYQDIEADMLEMLQTEVR